MYSKYFDDITCWLSAERSCLVIYHYFAQNINVRTASIKIPIRLYRWIMGCFFDFLCDSLLHTHGLKHISSLSLVVNQLYRFRQVFHVSQGPCQIADHVARFALYLWQPVCNIEGRLYTQLKCSVHLSQTASLSVTSMLSSVCRSVINRFQCILELLIMVHNVLSDCNRLVFFFFLAKQGILHVPELFWALL